MTNLLKLPTWADEDYIYAVIETPRGSTCKMNFDADLRAFTLAKPLMAGLSCPYDWGFVPSTKADDGDPLDVLVIHDAKTYPGVILRCRAVGVLEHHHHFRTCEASERSRVGTIMAFVIGRANLELPVIPVVAVSRRRAAAAD